eukprot:TRINITY_DN23002_c0_g2_i1.p1 TRINITY_DN23002_c0_g2~~TRINITY_DN23002_c0_g2_i1.p1  ORF type:complete len:311 (-),score=23.66 TRINITY_DN23002_c0_g2_i1:130-1062(-)
MSPKKKPGGRSSSRDSNGRSSSRDVARTKASARAPGGAPLGGTPGAAQEALASALKRVAGCSSDAASAEHGHGSQSGALEPGKDCCSACGKPYMLGQTVFSGGAMGKSLCESCARASLVARHTVCCICRGPFAPGQEVFTSPANPNLNACEPCVRVMRAAAKSGPPENCSDCKAPLASGASFATRAGPLRFLCSRCVDNQPTPALPSKCNRCDAQFPTNGSRVYRSLQEDGAFLCASCAENEMPKCGSCGTLVRGSHKFCFGKAYHSECLVCAECSCQINGQVARSKQGGLICGTCRVNNLQHQVLGLIM